MSNDIPIADIPFDRIPAPQDIHAFMREPCEGMAHSQWVSSWYWLDDARTVFLGTRHFPGGEKRIGIWEYDKKNTRLREEGLSVRLSTNSLDIFDGDGRPVAHFPTLEKAVLGMLALAPGIWPNAVHADDVSAELTKACDRLRNAIASGRIFISQRFAVLERRPMAREFLNATTIFCRLCDSNGAMSDAAGRRKRTIRISADVPYLVFEISNSRGSSQFKGRKISGTGFKTIYGPTAEDVYRRILGRFPPLLTPHLSGHEAMALADFIHSEEQLALSGQPFLIPIIEFERSTKL